MVIQHPALHAPAPGGGPVAAGDRCGCTNLEHLVLRLSAPFAGAAATEVDRAVDRALAELGAGTAVDRSYVFRIDPGGASCSNTHEWCAPGVAPQRDALQGVPHEAAPNLMASLSSGEVVDLPDVGSLDGAWVPERDLLGPQGIRSLLAVPLAGPAGWAGFLGLDSVRSRRRWDDDEVAVLRVLADILVGAFDRQATAAALRETESRFTRAFELAPNGIAIVNAGEGIVRANQAFAALAGRSPAELVGTPVLDLVDADHAELARTLAGQLQSGDCQGVAFDTVLRGASPVDASVLVSRISPEGDAATFVVHVIDQRERHRLEAELAHRTMHDELTGLPNRALLVDRLDVALSRLERAEGHVAVLVVDLDDFRALNETSGRHVGDSFLQVTADRLAGALRSGDTLARVGADEYVAVCAEVADLEEAMAVATRLAAVVAEPMDLVGQRHRLTACIGLALGDGGTDPERLLRDADLAIRQAKAKGSAQVQVLDSEAAGAALDRLGLESDLRSVLDADQLRVVYQPIVEAASGRVGAVEALLRWEHPTRGEIAPEQFVGVAERTGLIVAIGGWVLDQACRDVAAQGRALGRPIGASVNLSARQLLDPALVETVERALQASGLEARRLCLEVTETAVMDDLDACVDALRRVRQLGVRVAIDDFGTGYSSLGYLRDLPVDVVKVDRSFVRRVGDDDADAAILRSVVELGHGLGLSVVAEGVETDEQQAVVVASGCDRWQGYRCSAPIPIGALSEILTSEVSG